MEEWSDEVESSESDAEEQHQEETAYQENIYNEEELHERLEDIMWEGADFIDTHIADSVPGEAIPDIEDDLQRELVFYNQALAGAQNAVSKLQEAGVAWQRPPDYYAEMVKSDAHMARIKEQLVYEQRQIEESEERRKQRDAKKHNKEIQAERLKEKAQARKQSISSVNKLRKQRQQTGFSGELDMDAELAKMERPNQKSFQRISKSRNPISKKREAKNAKFGFGGRKRLQKQNDASSAANMESYRPTRKAKAGKSQRPGKSRRNSMKTGR